MDNLKKLIEQELLDFLKNSKNSKPYMQSMKEINIWLNEKSK